MITGTVVLDLTVESDAHDRRVVGYLYGIPAGIRVVVNIGGRGWPSLWLVDQMRQYVNNVHFDIHGDTSSVQAWVRALRGEDLSEWGAAC